MIIDSHCHAFARWPDASVPDPETRGIFEQLRFEMDSAGVDMALIIAGGRVPGNSDYVMSKIGELADRYVLFPDVDCKWSENYHVAGAADRLSAVVDKYRPRGFTHYLRDDDDGSWLLSTEGRAFFAVAAQSGLIVSLHILPHQLHHLRQLARAFPAVPFLIHHLGLPRLDEGRLREVLACGVEPNLHVKISAFDAGYPRAWDYPYPLARPFVMRLIEAFGPERSHWGSNFPMSRSAMTYRQTLECLREHVPVTSTAVMDAVLGESLLRLLEAAGHHRAAV